MTDKDTLTVIESERETVWVIDTLQAGDFSEGDEVDTPAGPGVVVEIRTEEFEGPDGETHEPTEDAPLYIVAVEEGARVYEGDELSDGEIDADVENPEGELAGDEETDTNADTMCSTDVLQEGHFNYPDSWEESETPNRLILLKAWAGLGGRFTTCRREMAGEVTRPNAFCADMKDRVLMWEGWRQ